MVVESDSHNTVRTARSLSERIAGRPGSEQPRASLGRDKQLGFYHWGSGCISGISYRKKGQRKEQRGWSINTHVPTWPMKSQFGFQAQEEAGEVPWPFSCEVVVGRFSKRDEHALEEGEELQVAVDPQAAQAALRPVARDRHTERDRVSYERDNIRRWPRGLKGARTSLDRTLRLVGTWNAR